MRKQILLIELAGIGDLVLSSPLIRNLKDNNPGTAIYFLSFADTAGLLQKSPYLDRVFVLRKSLWGFMDNLFVLNKLRKLDIDLAINLKQHYTFSGAIKMYLLLRFIKTKQSLGRNTDGKGFFYNIKIDDKINTPRHEVEYKLDLLTILGYDIKNKKLEVWFDDSDKIETDDFLESKGILDSDLLIGINPGGFRPTRRWNWKNFSGIAEILTKKYKAKIIITGTKGEGWLAEKIGLSASCQIIDSCGKLSLTQLAALIKRCNLYISNDTGPMHIANALGTPLLAIIGPGRVKLAPYQEKNCIILKKQVECAPCYKFHCRDMRCLKNITPDEVIGAAGILLKDYVKD